MTLSEHGPYRLAAARERAFARGSWGGEWHPDFVRRASDIVVKEHRGASGVQEVIVIGLIANTCVEGTSRFAVEPGYQGMRAAHEVNGLAFAHAILTTRDAIAALSRALRGLP